MINFYQNIIESKIPYVMGIVNVTPDSFSDGGKYLNSDDAINHASKLLHEGADIIDIGGESTRPGANPVAENDELDRVIPVIKGILKKYPNTIISIDTTKSKVAEAAVSEGAKIINDISGGIFDENILSVAGNYNVPYVLMHMKGNPMNMQSDPFYEDTLNEISEFFTERIDLLKKYNINKIILDPGIGFGKRIEDNYRILSRLNHFSRFHFPILLGVSNKSFLGKSLNIDINDRFNATIIAETIAVLNGAKIIRTHNVKNAVELKNIYGNLVQKEMLSNV